ncbi:MAG: Mov34/MPN/PAD-1 family protein [Carnobacterium inhibens]|uniref:Mov34/MPN/PAD-1 family protein n=1 Tax=Carnobacterium sp. TaxID=48221 RepID=UPI0033163281
MINQYLSVELMNNKTFPYSLCIQKSVLDKIKAEYKQARYWEIGGILFGKISRNRKTIFIEKAEPIKGKKLFSLAYIRNGKRAQKVIDSLWKETQGELNYLGEWHTHPNILPIPSQRDKHTILELTSEKKSNYFPYTILIIMGKDQRLTITVSNEKGIIECIHIP